MRLLPPIALLGLLVLPAAARAQDACDLAVDCSVQPADGVQPCSFDQGRTIDRAANAALGAQGPAMPSIRSGCAGGVEVPGRVPCQILRAFGWLRSGWQQFCADGCGAGSHGPTRLSARCGIGLMGLPPNEPDEAVDLARVASSSAYNAGAGARRLVQAWEATPCVGAEDPDVAEHWYFAVWAADEFTYVNNPNNPAYPVLRGTFGSASGFDRSSYPFQEIVFGLAGHPPSDNQGLLWNPAPVNLPASRDICGTAACLPADVASPAETHDRSCPPFVPPVDGGIADGGSGDAGDLDAGADAGNVIPDPREPGCGCEMAGAAGRGGEGVALLALAWMILRGRSGSRSR